MTDIHDMLALRRKLQHEVTAFDTREEAAAEKNPRRFHNIYALGIYLQRVDGVVAAVACGDSLPRALYDNFQDTLLSRLEKSFALPVTHGGGKGDTGRPA